MHAFVALGFHVLRAANVGPLYLSQGARSRDGKPGKYRCFRSRNLSVRLARFATSTKRPPMARTGWSFGRGGLPSAPRSPASSTKQACKDAPLKELWPPSRVAIGSAAHAGSAIENFYRECANGSPGCQGQANCWNCTRQCAPTLSLLAHHRIDYRHREGESRAARGGGRTYGASSRDRRREFRSTGVACSASAARGSMRQRVPPRQLGAMPAASESPACGVSPRRCRPYLHLKL